RAWLPPRLRGGGKGHSGTVCAAWRAGRLRGHRPLASGARMDRVRLLAAVLAAVVALAGCGAGERRDATERGAPPASVSAARGGAPAAQHGPWPVALPAGRGPAFRLPARGAAVAHARAVGRLRCLADRGAYVRGGRCSYAVRTSEPTGLLELRRGARLTLGDLFAVWGQPLGPRRLGAFRAPVRA